MGLVPVDPGAAVLDRRPVPSARSTSDRRAGRGLEQEHRAAAQRGLAGGGNAGEAAADDDHVVHRRPPRRALTATGRRSNRVDRDRAVRAHEHGVELDQLERLLDQDLADPFGQPRHRGQVDRRRPRPPVNSGAPRNVRSAPLDPAAPAGQRHDRDVGRAPRSRRRRARSQAPARWRRRGRRRSARPRARPSARRALTPSVRRRAREAGRMRSGPRPRSAGRARSRRASDLCWIPGALSFSAMCPPSSPSAATASSGSKTTRPSTTFDARAAQQLLGVVLGQPFAPTGPRTACRATRAISRSRSGSPAGCSSAAAHRKPVRRPATAGMPSWMNRQAASSSSSSGQRRGDDRRRPRSARRRR